MSLAFVGCTAVPGWGGLVAVSRQLSAKDSSGVLQVVGVGRRWQRGLNDAPGGRWRVEARFVLGQDVFQLFPARAVVVVAGAAPGLGHVGRQRSEMVSEVHSPHTRRTKLVTKGPVNLAQPIANSTINTIERKSRNIMAQPSQRWGRGSCAGRGGSQPERLRLPRKRPQTNREELARFW